MRDVGKYIIGTACNYEIYFDLCAFPVSEMEKKIERM
jgi:hypothetical protein